MAQYRDGMRALAAKADETYAYMNFDRIDAYRPMPT
jgi:hypothetical protein